MNPLLAEAFMELRDAHAKAAAPLPAKETDLLSLMSNDGVLDFNGLY